MFVKKLAPFEVVEINDIFYQPRLVSISSGVGGKRPGFLACDITGVGYVYAAYVLLTHEFTNDR